MLHVYEILSSLIIRKPTRLTLILLAITFASNFCADSTAVAGARKKHPRCWKEIELALQDFSGRTGHEVKLQQVHFFSWDTTPMDEPRLVEVTYTFDGRPVVPTQLEIIASTCKII